MILAMLAGTLEFEEEPLVSPPLPTDCSHRASAIRKSFVRYAVSAAVSFADCWFHRRSRSLNFTNSGSPAVAISCSVVLLKNA